MLNTLRYGQTVFAQWLLALALLAIGTQAALPQGFMLDRNAATGGVSIVICTGHNTETRYVDFASGKILDKSPAEQGQSEVQPCVFSLAQAASVLTSDTPSQDMTFLSVNRVQPQTHNAPRTKPRLPTPHSRAPPVYL